MANHDELDDAGRGLSTPEFDNMDEFVQHHRRLNEVRSAKFAHDAAVAQDLSPFVERAIYEKLLAIMNAMLDQDALNMTGDMAATEPRWCRRAKRRP